uniref:Pep_M12B_propep domain-containing protein n=1 Tax=Macrostomum lignano TaxID=282301 RepID=A0A1I8H6C8_9PLAT
SASREARDIESRESSYRFFHSGGESEADGGFHWFAVQLNETVLIRSVTVKVREVGSSTDFLRAKGIEIFTSNRVQAIFSGDHCRSKGMSRQYEDSEAYWTKCGQTDKKGSITAGESLKVDCPAPAAEEKQPCGR